MALYITNKANLFEIESKTGQSGKEYVTCNAVFYSKSKDANGEYTVADDAFKVRAVAFGKNAEYLQSFEDGKVFVNLKGKLSTVKYEKDGETRYTNTLNIISVSEFQSASADASENAGNDFDDCDVPF